MQTYRIREALALAWLALALVAAPQAARAERMLASAHVLDVTQLADRDKRLALELSGLAWDHDERLLVAVSDRGALHRLRIATDGKRIESVSSLQSVGLAGGLRIDAESLCLQRADNGVPGDSRAWVVDERGLEILVADYAGRIESRRALPAPLRDAWRYDGANRGVEAVACHARHGVLAVPQRPLKPHDRHVHRIYAEDGRVWAFAAARGGKSSIKGLHLFGGRRLLVLEKLGLEQERHRVLLREVDLKGCAEAAPCDPPAIALDDARLGAPDNFEGLACMSKTRCWIASDSGSNPAAATRLALLRLDRKHR